jgi:hypothetical protein
MIDLEMLEDINLPKNNKGRNGMFRKILIGGAIAGALVSIGGGIVRFAPWETSDSVAIANKEQDKRITDTEKNVIELKGDIQTIDERTKNMEKLQYIILKEVRK